MLLAWWGFRGVGRTVGSLPTSVVMKCGLSLPTDPAKNRMPARAAFCVASSVVTEPQSVGPATEEAGLSVQKSSYVQSTKDKECKLENNAA